MRGRKSSYETVRVFGMVSDDDELAGCKNDLYTQLYQNIHMRYV